MQKLILVATCPIGLEAVLKQEIIFLGYDILLVNNGRIHFEADMKAIARVNIFLRTASRVFLLIKSFKASDFDLFFDGISAIEWGKYIPKDAKIIVNSKNVKSNLKSEPTNQRVGKKAILKSLEKYYETENFSETGLEIKIELLLENDNLFILLDLSGEGLQKRSYRTRTGDAPIKETLAAALVLLSRWRPKFPLIDPFCGSGTILIEAAMIACNIAPGKNRSFISEKYEFINKDIWVEAREEASRKEKEIAVKIIGYDNDDSVLKLARINAKNAGVEDFIDFHKRDVNDFQSSFKNGTIITNPPYGERMGEQKEVEILYKNFGKIFQSLNSWSVNIITSIPRFQETFGKRANKNRKLYNGAIRSYFYQYFKM